MEIQLVIKQTSVGWEVYKKGKKGELDQYLAFGFTKKSAIREAKELLSPKYFIEADLVCKIISDENKGGESL